MRWGEIIEKRANLIEIFDDDDISHVDPENDKIAVSQKPISSVIKNKNYSVANTGEQAIAFFHKKFPGKVIKTIEIMGKWDPAYNMIRLAMNHQSNPFFPKIYTAKVYPSKYWKDKQGGLTRSPDETAITKNLPDIQRYVLLVVMEKLLPLDSSNITSSVLNKMGFASTSLLINKLTPLSDKDKQWLSSEYNYTKIGEFTARLTLSFDDKKFREHLIRSSSNEDFKEAMTILEPYFNHHQSDFRADNIMKRNDGSIVLLDLLRYFD